MEAHGVEPEAPRLLQPLHVDVARGGREAGEHLDVVVAVAAKVERLAVEEQHVAPRGLQLAHAEALVDAIALPPALPQRDGGGVEVRLLRRPQARIGDGDDDLDFGATSCGHLNARTALVHAAPTDTRTSPA